MTQWDSKSFHNLVLERDRVCQHCGGPDLLQAHHVNHRANGGEDDPANGICLCAGCHADEHPDIPPNFFFIKAWGPYNPGGWSATYVAGLLNCHPRSVVRHARKAGIKREGQYWTFTEDDLVSLQCQSYGKGASKKGNPIPFVFDDETRRQIDDLARWWGLTRRYVSSVIVRCIERAWHEERERHAANTDSILPST